MMKASVLWGFFEFYIGLYTSMKNDRHFIIQIESYMTSKRIVVQYKNRWMLDIKSNLYLRKMIWSRGEACLYVRYFIKGRVYYMTNLFSLNDCYEIWKKNSQNKLNPLTLRRYTNLVDNHLLPYFENIAVRDITEKDIKIFLDRKQKDGMAEVTRNMIVMLLKKFFRIAEIDTTKLGLEHAIHIKQSRRTVEILEKEEQSILDKILSSSENEKYISIYLAFKLGLAIGEICALMWKDVDFDKEVIYVRETVQRIQNIQEKQESGRKTILVKMPLSDAGVRELPVPEMVLKTLNLYREDNGYVLKCKEGKLPDPRREQMRLERIFKKNEMKGCNFHTLRDTFAVRCLQAGMSIEDLSYVLGHSSVTGTAERYKGFVEMKENRRVVLRRIMELV